MYSVGRVILKILFYILEQTAEAHPFFSFLNHLFRILQKFQSLYNKRKVKCNRELLSI